MTDYLGAMVDPGDAMRGSVNTLQNMYVAKQRDRQLDQTDQQIAQRNRMLDIQEGQEGRAKQAQTLQLMAIPFEYTKIKTGHMAKIAQRIKNLPTMLRVQKYSDLINKVGPTPIAVHPQLGPLGTFNSDSFLSPAEFAKLDDKQQMEYLDAVAGTASEISKFDIMDKDYNQKADLINQQHANRLEEIRARGEETRKTAETGDDISGQFSQEEIDLMGATYNLKGKLPAMGRGKAATALRKAVLKSAAQQALQAGGTAQDVVAGQADVKAIAGSLNYQEKQFGAMGSFVKNLDAQVEKVKELAKDFETFDTRLLNIPLRSIRGRLAGSPMQAKYEMYLTEIESEIGKLATGSTASVAELSQGAQEKWSRIHDKNLSIKDMISLLEETKHAGRIRMKSVADQLKETRKKMRGLSSAGTMQDATREEPTVPSQGIQTAEDYLRKLRGQ